MAAGQAVVDQAQARAPQRGGDGGRLGGPGRGRWRIGIAQDRGGQAADDVNRGASFQHGELAGQVLATGEVEQRGAVDGQGRGRERRPHRGGRQGRPRLETARAVGPHRAIPALARQSPRLAALRGVVTRVPQHVLGDSQAGPYRRAGQPEHAQPVRVQQQQMRRPQAPRQLIGGTVASVQQELAFLSLCLQQRVARGGHRRFTAQCRPERRFDVRPVAKVRHRLHQRQDTGILAVGAFVAQSQVLAGRERRPTVARAQQQRRLHGATHQPQAQFRRSHAGFGHSAERLEHPGQCRQGHRRDGCKRQRARRLLGRLGLCEVDHGLP